MGDHYVSCKAVLGRGRENDTVQNVERIETKDCAWIKECRQGIEEDKKLERAMKEIRRLRGKVSRLESERTGLQSAHVAATRTNLRLEERFQACENARAKAESRLKEAQKKNNDRRNVPADSGT